MHDAVDRSKTSALIDLQLLPSLEYFVALGSMSSITIDRHEHFVKQTYRNRCHILGANGLIRLTVPVVKGSQKSSMEDVNVDFSHPWKNIVWRSIISAYGKSPFFEYFSDELRVILFNNSGNLFELNLALLSFCLNCLQLDISLTFTNEYVKSPESPIFDLRNTITPKKSWQENKIYSPFPYQQIFGNKFVPNLSIIDLIFCEGPNAKDILSKSTISE